MQSNVIFCYRYLWKIKGSESINVKIVSDVRAGLDAFEKVLLELPDLESCGKEYVCEYDCNLISCFIPLKVVENSESEVK